MPAVLGRPLRHGVVAGLAGAVLSGAPSTCRALVAGDDPLVATRAAGRVLVPQGEGVRVLMAAGALHLSLSLGWSLVLTAVLPRRRTVTWGAVAGLGIAAIDLGLIGRRIPAIRGLAPGPQIADHVAFGMTVGWVLTRLTRPARPARGGQGG